MSDPYWSDDAACRLDPEWTSDKPDWDVQTRLAAICARCPVFAECAEYALDNRLECGTYAGVFLPSRAPQRKAGETIGWVEAGAALRRKLKAA